ncbi:MAG: hypothetical protein HFJ59_07475 [Clostridia bacterium]|nr:hypothetical protein [Clostridia bacterium]
MEKNRKYIAIISFLRKFITAFFTLFFNIYILKIVNNDLNFIIKYTVFGVIIGLFFEYIILKIINAKNAKIIYRASFPLILICIMLLIVFKEKIINYIYLFKLLHTLATICYSAPYELIVIGSNNDKTMSNFLANINILESITTILTPIFSGYIINRFSYNIFFIILTLEVIIIILVTIQIKDFTISNKKLEIKKYWNLSKSKNYIQDIYKCMFYRRISTHGAMVELLPIILFWRLGKELDFGTYNSIFAILSILSLQILKIINSKNIEKKFYPYLAVIIFISSIFVVYNSSFSTLLIYYILMNTFGIIIESESCSVVYTVINIEDLMQYKKEHIFIFNIYMTIGQLISYGLLYILYKYFYNINILSITVSILMFFLIISTIYLRKAEKYLYMKNNKME